MSRILYAKNPKREITEQIARLIKEKKYLPKGVILSIGNDPASKVYIRHKKKLGEKLGISIEIKEFPEKVTQKEVIENIQQFNEDPAITGIILQLPISRHLNEDLILREINYKKDIDGIHPYNMGLLTIGKPILIPATPLGILKFLEFYQIETQGKHCVVLGRSRIVGRPMSVLLSQKPYNATCTIAHSYTQNLKEITRQADILIVAVGKKQMITSEYLKPGAIVIDVGIHRTEAGKLCGDVQFEEVQKIAGAITPVPGGVGPMTVTALMLNIIKAYEWQNNLSFSF